MRLKELMDHMKSKIKKLEQRLEEARSAATSSAVAEAMKADLDAARAELQEKTAVLEKVVGLYCYFFMCEMS
jgi:hypothetical protein